MSDDDSEMSNSEMDTIDININGPYENPNSGLAEYDDRDDDNDGDDGKKADAHLKFVRVLKRYPIILSKSQMPCVKMQKNLALQSMMDDLEQETGTRYRGKQILKKVNNMKTKVRGKMVRWETNGSNKQMPRWADEMLDLISGDYTTESQRMATGGDFTNEDISQNYIPALDTTEDIKPQTRARVVNRTSSTSSASGGVHAGTATTSQNNTSSNNRASSNSSSLYVKSALEAYETDETRHMSNTDLQRLVYLEQLKLARIQTNYYKLKTNAQRKKINNR